MPKNTSNARFRQVLSEIWPAEVFWSQNSCGRAQTEAGRPQTGPKSQRTLDGHISLKTCPNQAFEVFFGIYRKCRCQKTPQTPDSDTFCVRYGLQKFSGLKTHVGGRRRVASCDDGSCRAMTQAGRTTTQAGCATTGPSRVQTSPGRA